MEDFLRMKINHITARQVRYVTLVQVGNPDVKIERLRLNQHIRTVTAPTWNRTKAKSNIFPLRERH